MWGNGSCILGKTSLYTNIMGSNFIIRAHHIYKTVLGRRGAEVQGNVHVMIAVFVAI